MSKNHKRPSGSNNSYINGSNNSTTTSSDNSDTNISDEKFSVRDIIYNVRDAVVNISSHSTLITNECTKTSIIKGNGFFIRGHYIVCPASLVLDMPCTKPNIDDTNPSHNKIKDPDSPITCYNRFVKKDRILVAVSNVNGGGQSYSYEAKLIGIDGVANIAILIIDMVNKWNESNMPIQSCHPFIYWGKSRNTCPGDTVIVIGDINVSSHIGLTNCRLSENSENAVVIGNIADNRYVSYGGMITGELLLLSNILSQGCNQGMPVITLDGKVIGMTVSSNKSEFNIALSEFFMRRPMKAIIKCSTEKDVPVVYKGFIERIDNDYIRFNKGWLGLGGILMTQDDYNTKIRFESECNIIRELNNKSISGCCKNIVGYRILVIDTKTSTIDNILQVGDIITHINNCPLGDRKGQISPSLVMWRVRPGNTVTINYKKESERFDTVHEGVVVTGSYDPSIDFPWYSVPIPQYLQTIMPILI